MQFWMATDVRWSTICSAGHCSQKWCWAVLFKPHGDGSSCCETLRSRRYYQAYESMVLWL